MIASNPLALACPPPAQGETITNYASRVLVDSEQLERDWGPLYDRALEYMTRDPSYQFGMSATDFQSALIRFVAMTYDYNYYGIHYQPRSHPLRSELSSRNLHFRERYVARVSALAELETLVCLFDQNYGRIDPHIVMISAEAVDAIFNELPRSVLRDMSQHLPLEFFEHLDLVRSFEVLPPIPLVVTQAPALEHTLSPGEKLRTSEGAGFVTAGAFVARGQLAGVITVAHGLGDEGHYVNNKRVYDRREGVIDAAWDVAWFPVSKEERLSYPRDFPSRTLSAPPFAPRRGQEGFFYGAASGSQRAVVDAIGFEIPNLSKYHAARFSSPRVTKPGDSGSIFWSDDCEALGMAVARTQDFEALSYSVWQWFPGVLHVLDGILMQLDEIASRVPTVPPPDTLTGE